MNLPRALILALSNKEKEAKLRTICYRLKEIGKTKDADGDDVLYLDMVTYGISGIPFSRINKLFDREK